MSRGVQIQVVGIGATQTVGQDSRSIPEIVLEAVEGALADADLSTQNIDAVVTASIDLVDGLTASAIAVTEVVGAVMKPETRIAADGLCALAHAACQLWAGAYETVLVVAHGKASMTSQQALTAWTLDPIYLQPLGVDYLSCAGLNAQVLAATDPGSVERWAQIASTRHNAGSSNNPRSAEEVLASPLVASPLTEAMCVPAADGAYAVVLRRGEPTAKKGVWLRGIGHDLERHNLGERDLSRWSGLVRARDRALAQSELEDARSFDLLEPSCSYAFEEELFLQAMGPREDAVISPDGGLFGGAVPVAAGLSRFCAAALRMRSQPELRHALAHGTWGPAGQGQVVAVLEGVP